MMKPKASNDELSEKPMAETTNDPDAQPSPRVMAIRRAAVAFANDYGPLPVANQGDDEAQHRVGAQLMKALRAEGLTIQFKSP